jgi:hypothetical protein
VAGLPAAALDVLAAPEVESQLERARDCSRIAEQMSGPLSDHLFALIPTLDGRVAERRAALKLRRDVHNQRFTAPTQRAADQTLPLLPATQRDTLRTWTAAVHGVAEALERLDALIREDDARVTEHLLGALRSAPIAGSLAFASPPFTRELLRADPASGGRLTRTALAYYTRAAAKTSPFGALATLGTVVIGEAHDGVTAEFPEQREVVSPLHLAVHLLQACAVDPHRSLRLRFRVNPSLRLVDGRWRVMIPEHSPAQSGLLPMRGDESVAIAGPPDGPGTGSHSFTAWERGGAPGERSRVRRLIAAGLLLPDTPWTADSADPLGQLARQMADPSAIEPDTVSIALGELAAAEARMGKADAAERIRLDTEVRTQAAHVFSALGADIPHWLASAPLFHENVGVPSIKVPALPPTLRDDLQDLASMLRAHTSRSSLYHFMVRHFTVRYGHGGRCDDVLDFLYSFVHRADYPRLLKQASSLDDARPPGKGDDLLARGTVGAPHVTVFHQIDAPNQNDLYDGRYHVVVNQVNPGAVGLLTRWAGVPGIAVHLGDRLRSWMAAVHSGSRILQVSAGGDYSPAQVLRGRLFPELRWPSDLRHQHDTEGCDLSQLTLSHDADSDTLQLYAPDGASVAIPYMGVVPQEALQGPVRLLTMLSYPWRSSLAALQPLRFGTTSDDRVDPRPVAPTLGRLVMRRPSVRVAADRLPRPVAGERPAEYLIRVDAWRDGLGLSRQCFARVVPVGNVRPGKPFWVDLSASRSVQMLLKEADSTDATVEFTEAIPDPRSSWLADELGRPRAAELVAAVRLDQPSWAHDFAAIV